VGGSSVLNAFPESSPGKAVRVKNLVHPKVGDWWRSRGNIRLSRGEYDQALRGYDEALRLQPNDAMTLNAKAWLHATAKDQRIRDGKKAIALARNACEVRETAEFLATLAAAYAEAGQFSNAVLTQEKALDRVSRADEATAERRLNLYQQKKTYQCE
jgi:tetratricopeptide (TPR) repeat protein